MATREISHSSDSSTPLSSEFSKPFGRNGGFKKTDWKWALICGREKKEPAFFKFYVEEINGKTMEIPRGFINQIQEPLPETARFRDALGKIWRVKVVNTRDDKFYFANGWVKFVQDNMLESGDMLVFEYFNNGFFNVKMFGISTTEKRGGRIVTSLSGEMITEDSSEYSTESSDTDGDDDLNDDDMFEDQHNEIINIESDNSEETEDDPAIQTGYLQPMTCRPVGMSKEKVARPSSDEERYGVDIFKAGLAPQPQNPYFVTKIMEKRTGVLFIPKDVVKDNDLKLEGEIFLYDHLGRAFNGVCRTWSDGRVLITGGWIKLCTMNLISNDDKCICEFVEDESGRLSIHVNIVRADAIIDRLPKYVPRK